MVMATVYYHGQAMEQCEYCMEWEFKEYMTYHTHTVEEWDNDSDGWVIVNKRYEYLKPCPTGVFDCPCGCDHWSQDHRENTTRKHGDR